MLGSIIRCVIIRSVGESSVGPGTNLVDSLDTVSVRSSTLLLADQTQFYSHRTAVVNVSILLQTF